MEHTLKLNSLQDIVLLERTFRLLSRSTSLANKTDFTDVSVQIS